MFNGHRGLNHPVKNVIIDHCEVTSQNHGFGVVQEAVKASDKVEITHVNLNDKSIEGIRVKGKKAFRYNITPESSPGPHDSRYLFDDFIDLMKHSLMQRATTHYSLMATDHSLLTTRCWPLTPHS